MSIIKRILTVLALSVMVFSLVFTASAEEPGGFVESPSNNLAPTLVSSSSPDHPCDEPLIITAYADRGTLPEAFRVAIEKAYSEIKSAKNLALLCEALKDYANERGISTAGLAVSDLFDISDACSPVEAHFDIVLKAETLENFVALLHYVDGEWVIVEDATVSDVEGEKHLTFSVDSLSPFAIVIDTGATPPREDNSILIAILAVIAIAEAAALVAILVKFILGKKFA